jgi:hypothetical protein
VYSNGPAAGTTGCLLDVRAPFDIVEVSGSPAIGSRRE